MFDTERGRELQLKGRECCVTLLLPLKYPQTLIGAQLRGPQIHVRTSEPPRRWCLGVCRVRVEPRVTLVSPPLPRLPPTWGHSVKAPGREPSPEPGKRTLQAPSSWTRGPCAAGRGRLGPPSPRCPVMGASVQKGSK